MPTSSKHSPCVGIRTCTDYSPFGVELDGRTVSGGYRFGFNTQEKTDEISGLGNHTTALYWEYDSRLGRRWNLDPKPNQSTSLYNCNTNNPILFSDPNGDTITKLPSFLNNQSLVNGWDVFASTKQGKKFIEDFSEGGKYSHINVIFEARETGAGCGGWTETYSINKKTGEKNRLTAYTYNKETKESSWNYLKDAAQLAKGTSAKNNLQFVITLNQNQSPDEPGKHLFMTFVGADILHEIQHVRINILSLLELGRTRSSLEHHEMMRKKELPYLNERISYWWQTGKYWHNDYVKKKNDNAYNIETKSDYIEEKDSFLDN